MKKIFIFFAMAVMLFSACQDKDYDIQEAKIQPISSEAITGQLQGDDYVWKWTQQEDYDMQVTLYVDGTMNGSVVVSENSYTHSNVNTNVEYTYVFKLTDGENYSTGVVKSYTREGATQISGLSMSQVDKAGGYDVLVEWNQATDAETVLFTATNGTRTISQTLDASQTTYTITDVEVDETWTVTLVAQNSKGESLSTSSSLRVGKTSIGFLSIYPTEEELIANGDDDEASAWLWLKSEYETSQYVYFGDITSAETIEPYRVLFWLRDLEDVDESEVFDMPQVVDDATPYIQSWYKDGGSLLLWSHAIPYISDLGRIDASLLKSSDHAIGTSAGAWNADAWSMAVELNPGSSFKVDFSSHAIYKGLDVETTDRTKLITFKGPGWTEDHNCVFYNIPASLTGLGNQEEDCYTQLTEQYGIYPLGTWDSQIDWVSQLNVWEAQQGNTEYKGTVLCIGNGGCEFSMKNEDGTPDISAYPTNNSYQDNILLLAKNSLEYLKTR